jgi:hypothetical protein
MIKIKDGTKKDKDGNEVDDSIYIGKYDYRNMIIFKLGGMDKRTGEPKKKIMGYFSSIDTLLKHSLDFLAKDSPEARDLSEMRDMIALHIDFIERVMGDCPKMIEIMREEKD